MAEKEKKDSSASQIRIVKRGKGHGGHHGGAWKVAYADFVTAMMAFFLVMWIVGLSSNVKQAIAGYFQDPVAFMEAVEAGKAAFQAPGVNPGTGYKGPDDTGAASDRAKLAAAKKSIEKMIAASLEFKDVKNFIDVKMVTEGLQIDLIDGKENLFFDSGSAKIKAGTDRLLRKMAQELGKLQNKIIIEGHTDIRPLSRRAGYSNWELSADRANSARSIMESGGLARDQVDQVRGYAATHPRNKDPYHYSNRRVSIIVVMNHTVAKDKASVGSEEDVTEAVKKSPAHPDAAEASEKPFKIDINPH